MLRYFNQFGISPTFSLKYVLTFAAGTIFGFTYFHIWIDVSRWKSGNAFPTTDSRADYLYTRDVKKFQNNFKIYRGYLPIVYEVDRSVADVLAQRVRILCWVVTDPSGFDQAKAIKATWGQRCNALLFTSTKASKKLPTVMFNMTTDWGKTKQGLKYIYENYMDSADWILKVDVHHYVIVENLRHMLEPHSPDSPVYFGRQFHRHTTQGYMSGGAGYVLSRAALRRFVERGLNKPTLCRSDDGGLEDVELGICLKHSGVAAGDSRDRYGLGRFFPFDPATHIVKDLRDEEIRWYWEFSNISYPERIDCCSETTIAFHYVFRPFMYNYDYFLYNLHTRLIN
ncbi:hypothetical protein JTE90_025033 [Oedothorax gibbosus]|uniref:N-acetylgalactosaminide beta-1,3-galactosyltransferase n=1 Tax=Oedothorax gibbosus TaxID=931172 RepID=A0AAV6TR04_9ARAC|nr:hypothetical protein JTE90_025033 [Oedothorax gibbosus]